MIQAKADVSEPVMVAGFFAILMLFRVLMKTWAAAFDATLASPVLTALIEAEWNALLRHIDL